MVDILVVFSQIWGVFGTPPDTLTLGPRVYRHLPILLGISMVPGGQARCYRRESCLYCGGLHVSLDWSEVGFTSCESYRLISGLYSLILTGIYGIYYGL